MILVAVGLAATLVACTVGLHADEPVPAAADVERGRPEPAHVIVTPEAVWRVTSRPAPPPRYEVVCTVLADETVTCVERRRVPPPVLVGP